MRLAVVAVVALLSTTIGGAWLIGGPDPAAAAAPAYAVTSPAPSDGRVGIPYTHTFSGDPAGATWAVTAGALPAGLVLNPENGVLSGTPTAAGTFAGIEVTASWTVPYTAIAAGGFHTCGLTAGGAADCWGANGAGQAADHPGPYTAIDAGFSHTCALTPAGAADCWGDDASGQATDQAGPYTSIATGDSHTCALTPSGAADCWGLNTLGNAADQPGPYTAIDVAFTPHTCASTAAGAVDCWGSDGYGEATDRPGPFTAISAGNLHTCGLSAAGAADCWGDNDQGQAADQPGPYSAIAAGTIHTCGLTAAGAADCWGNNAAGQGADQPGPYTAIDAGNAHTCALTTAGAADCWGENASGQASDRPGAVVASATQTFTITIAPAVAITSPLPGVGVVGGAYSHQFEGDPSGAHWTVTSGTLPEGLFLQPGGLLSGTPSAAGVVTGITVTGFWADFAIVPFDSQTFSMTVFDTVVSSGPPPVVNAAAVPAGGFEVGFDTVPSGLGATYQCRLNGAAPTACSSPFNLGALADGDYTLSVAATVGGVTDPVPAQWSWTVDATAPVVTSTDAPTTPTNDPVGVFAFTVDDPTATVTCSLDGATPVACASPRTTGALSDGPHTFTVVATDLVGNVGVPITHEWTVDTTPADVMITAKPALVTNDDRAAFEFESPDGSATFACSVDGAAPTSCSSPFTAGPLGDGPHTFAVTATDAAGNEGAPAAWAWTLDTVAPTVTFTSTPPGLSATASASLAFESDEAAAGFTCTLDGVVVEACASPLALEGLGDGHHMFTVAATDPAGNTGVAATHDWTVDTTAPTIVLTGTPPSDTVDTTATFTYTIDDRDEPEGATIGDRASWAAAGTTTLTCALDDLPAAACASPTTYTGLAVGAHTWTIDAVDLAGNVATAVHTWDVSAPPLPPTPTTLPSTVEGPVPPAAIAAAPASRAAAAELPPAGTDPRTLLGAAGLLLAVGLGAVVTARRGRSGD